MDHCRRDPEVTGEVVSAAKPNGQAGTEVEKSCGLKSLSDVLAADLVDSL